jgi:hypothetical protein
LRGVDKPQLYKPLKPLPKVDNKQTMRSFFFAIIIPLWGAKETQARHRKKDVEGSYSQTIFFSAFFF